MGIVSWIFWGLFVGAMARLLLPGRQKIGIVWTILLGVAGAVVGGFVATEALGIGGDAGDFDFGSFLIAVAGAFVLLALAQPVIARAERREESERR